MEIQQLLSAFNDDIQQNVKLIDYLARTNVFETIGKARNEMTHSKMLEYILTAFHEPKAPESPVVHLLDILIKRSLQQGNNTIPEELCNAVLCRSLPPMILAEHDTEVPLSVYRKGCDKKDRLDICLEFALGNPIKKGGSNTIRIFIENKVQSSEHDGQTTTYYDTCKNKRGESTYSLFVYLTPLMSRELNGYASLCQNAKPDCNSYISINYQDVLDGIIEPLLADERLDLRNRVLLKDYVNCLELPALPDDVSKKDMTIMATSRNETTLVDSFLQIPTNRELVELIVNHKTNGKLYSVDGEGRMMFDDAVKQALVLLINMQKNSYEHSCHDGELELLNAFGEIVTMKNNGMPFLVYSPDGRQYVNTLIYEHNGFLFSSFFNAVEHAVLDYQKQHGLRADETIDAFSAVYEDQNNGHPLLAKSAGEKYRLISDQLGMRRDVSMSVLEKINSVLDTPVQTVSDEAFHSILQNGGRMDYLTEFNASQYLRIDDTCYYFRKGMESKYEDINEHMGWLMDEVTLSDSDKTLLDSFYHTHKSMILSILKISTENKTDADSYEKKIKILKKLMRG